MKVDGASPLIAYYFCVGGSLGRTCVRVRDLEWAIAAQRWRFRMRLNAPVSENDFT